jgi:RbsD / FucU transport protein family
MPKPRSFLRFFLAVSALAIPASSSAMQEPGPGPNLTWQQILAERISYYGHRNWIVIADSAYPEQSRAGIETIVVKASQLQVLQTVLNQLDASRHVRPIAFTDQELKFVPETEAPGVSGYRETLAALLKNRDSNSLPHEQIISKLDTAGQTFRVLIIKTNMTIPYTSVFLQLDCAYWSAESERKLRAAIAASH